jgi:hypothetical protein
MGFCQDGQPAEATGLNHRKIHLRRLTGGDALTFLLHQQPQAQIMERRHRQKRGSTVTLAAVARASPAPAVV